CEADVRVEGNDAAGAVASENARRCGGDAVRARCGGLTRVPRKSRLKGGGSAHLAKQAIRVSGKSSRRINDGQRRVRTIGEVVESGRWVNKTDIKREHLRIGARCGPFDGNNVDQAESRGIRVGARLLLG